MTEEKIITISNDGFSFTFTIEKDKIHIEDNVGGGRIDIPLNILERILELSKNEHYNYPGYLPINL